ncbi:hypothetical protein LR48_Vigan09g070100 [Vigna angularis]|uniref:Uncharacterized protein n=1 Tax=Phaseolus angularis TaxID=3914 RepID=A0A0L9VAV5_PHAAN|nr:hypothetical protein LR48_Vigan09g070100 [Vigna angularis]
MDDIEVVIHHGGNFVNDGCLKYEGESAMHMVNLAHLNEQVHLYVVHTISQPDVIHMIEYNVDEGGEEVAPQVNEGGEVAQFAEGVDDGLRKVLDEGVGGDGERIKAQVVSHTEMTEAAEDEGERIEVDEGDVERTEADVVQEERIEVEEGDVEGERTEADVVQEERIEVEEGEVEGERTEADVVQEERIEVEEDDGERTTADEVHEERIEGQEPDVEAKSREANEVQVEVERIEVEEADGITTKLLPEGEADGQEPLLS